MAMAMIIAMEEVYSAIRIAIIQQTWVFLMYMRLGLLVALSLSRNTSIVPVSGSYNLPSIQVLNLSSIAMRIAKERKSSVLASNAYHHRIDSLTSIVALVAILGSHVLTNVSWLDPVGGLVVSMMVVRAGYANTGSALLELADVGVAEDIKDSVRKSATKALSEDSFASGRVTGAEVQVQDVQGVKAGQNYLVNLELAVPSDWTVKETRLVEDAVRERVGAKVRGVRRVRVRFVAKSEDTRDFTDEFIGANVSPRSSPEPEKENEAGHDHHHEHNHDKPTSNGDVRRRH
jgi:hypothetical protein